MRKAIATSFFVLGAVLWSCGGSSGGAGGSAGGGGASGSGGSAGGGAGNCKSGEVSLTVKNYLKWCTFEANGDKTTQSSAASETVCVPSGTVNLTATPLNSMFELGSDPWHDTTTESGGSATVDVSSGSKCVWVCCPFVGGTGCPTTDQCP